MTTHDKTDQVQVTLGQVEDMTVRCFGGFNDQQREFFVAGIPDLEGGELKGSMSSFTERHQISVHFILDRYFPTDEDTYMALNDPEQAERLVMDALPDLIVAEKASREIIARRTARAQTAREMELFGLDPNSETDRAKWELQEIRDNAPTDYVEDEFQTGSVGRIGTDQG